MEIEFSFGFVNICDMSMIFKRNIHEGKLIKKKKKSDGSARLEREIEESMHLTSDLKPQDRIRRSGERVKKPE